MATKRLYTTTLFKFASITILLVCILCSLWQWFIQPIEILASSVQLVNGRLILEGAVPHLDFWSKETPLLYYLNSAIFLIFGESIIWIILVKLLFYALVSWSFAYYYQLHQLEQSRNFKNLDKSLRSNNSIYIFALFSALLITFVLPQPKWIAYALGLLGLIIYLSGCKTNKNNILWLAVAGLFIGLTCLSKLNYGLYFALSMGLALAVYWFQNPTKTNLIKFLAFILPIFLCFAVYLIPYGLAAEEVIQQIFIFPVQHLTQHRIISLASISQNSWYLLLLILQFWLIVTLPLLWIQLHNHRYTPLFLAIATLPIIIIAQFQAPTIIPKLFIIPLIGITYFQLFSTNLKLSEFTILSSYSLFLHYYLSRSDAVHYAPLVPLILLLIVPKMIAYPSIKTSQKLWLLMVFIGLFFYPLQQISNSIIQVTSINIPQTTNLKELVKTNNDSQFLQSSQLPLTVPAAYFYPDTELAALQFVAQQTQPNDYVYIGVRDHSQVFISNIRSYWILNRQIPVKHYVLEPGLTTEAEIQTAMIKQLQAKQVDWIVLWQQFEAELDFQNRNYVGSNLLDRYITNNYQLIKTIDSYLIYQKKPLSLE